jgi:hypothetical protein
VWRKVLVIPAPLEQDFGETLRSGAGGRGGGLATRGDTPEYKSRGAERWASQKCGVSWPLWCL